MTKSGARKRFNMALKSPELKAPPHLLCDWVELKALSSPSGRFRISSLARLWDISRETEGSDPEGRMRAEDDTETEGVGGGDEDAFLSSILDEISERSDALGASYPFSISGSGTTLQVVGPPCVGGYIYIFCLLLSHASNSDVLDGTWLPNVNNRVRDLFQACSTVAAAAKVDGCAISFGWPRPNGNPSFLKRLKEVYEIFGEGVVVDKPRPGVSPAIKDEEIDVIAWTPTHDNAPGTFYMLGQVASGNNWMAKSVKGPPIENFHRNWFQPPPASQPIPSMFIPHSTPPVERGGTRRERLDVLTGVFGIIFDRLRLPRLADEGFILAAAMKNELTIERTEDLIDVANWVNTELHELHQAIVGNA
jgi:hypothetical protein